MADFVLTCGSTVDMDASFFTERHVAMVPYSYILDGVNYTDDLGKTLPYPAFYHKIANGAMPTTSQVSVAEYTAFFEPFLQEGKDVCHLAFSSGLTSSLNSANIARTDLLEQYPNRDILIVDSLCASSGYGLLVTMAADLRDQGKTKEEIVQWVERNRQTIHHWFFSTDLTHYKRGGRISAASAAIGTALNICPLMNVSPEGKLTPRYKVQGKKRVIRRTLDQMEQHALHGTDYDGYCYICTSDSFRDAETLRDLVEKRFPNLRGKVLINWIGCVIGAHTGPGTVALFFQGDPRET